MTQEDQSKVTMWKIIRRYLNQNEGIWAKNKPFKAAYDRATSR